MAIRGRGSVKEGQAAHGQTPEDLQDDMHVLITAESQESLNKVANCCERTHTAACEHTHCCVCVTSVWSERDFTQATEIVQKLLVPVDDDNNDYLPLRHQVQCTVL